MRLNRRQAIAAMSAGLFALHARRGIAGPQFLSPLGDKVEPMAKGKFEPTWESLQQYRTPDWYRDAKFGIWAHWGPQCQPEHGDWYARSMYIEGNEDYKFHLEHYGHPSQFGFKDVIHRWKAENWDPDKLISLYKRAGAQYFGALANHHDNFDNFDSQYQPWNAVQIGPQKDLIGGWARAARAQGLRFGARRVGEARHRASPAHGRDRGPGPWRTRARPPDPQLAARHHRPGPQEFEPAALGFPCCLPRALRRGLPARPIPARGGIHLPQRNRAKGRTRAR